MEARRFDMTISIVHADAALLAGIIELGRRHRRTLGFMPDEAFAERIAAGTLLVAIDQQRRLGGYVLYDLPRDEVKIVHLCVARDFRHAGLARQLVDHVAARHTDRRSIFLRCRRDYDANAVWGRLGFELAGEVRGRSRAGNPLNVWRRRLGDPDLFSWIATDPAGAFSAVIDANVFFDLHSTRDRPEESEALLAGWLAPEIELLITGEMGREIDRLDDAPERRRLKAAMDRYRRPLAEQEQWTPIYQALCDRAPDRDEQLDSDFRHLAMTAAARVPHFVTRDEKLLEQYRALVHDRWGVEIMLPAEFALLVDAQTRAGAYQPVRLQGTGYVWEVVPTGGVEALVERFLNRAEGERRPVFRKRLRSYVGDPKRYEVRVLRDAGGRQVAVLARSVRAKARHVHLLRVDPMADAASTLAHQILFSERNGARSDGMDRVVVEDTKASRAVLEALPAEAFYPVGATWQSLLVDARLSTAALMSRLEVVDPAEMDPRLRELSESVLPADPLNAERAADLESLLWPLKITDADLPTFIVSIRPSFAAELIDPRLGEGTLFPRPQELGLAREHVYYRRPGAARGISAPARVVWYVKHVPGRPGSGTIRACSTLIEVARDDADILFRRFHHLGVYTRKQVLQARNEAGEAMALRFTNTEAFPVPIEYSDAGSLARAHGHTLALESPQPVRSEFFEAIYERGFDRGRT